MAQPKLRKKLSAPGLVQTARSAFEKVPDHRSPGCTYSMPDALMSGLAIFGLKFPSLLNFDQNRNEPVIRHNLESLYGVKQAPCDTQLRSILDPVDPAHLRRAFRDIHRDLQRGKALEAYRFMGDYYLVSIDGTGQFSSGSIHCDDCCVKNHKNGDTSYYHQLLGAVLVHPDLSTVLPLAPEPITHQDGNTKNDCERNASKRLLAALREEHPYAKFIILEDGLASNGPHLKLLKKLKIHFITEVKPGDHEALFATVQEKLVANECEELEKIDEHGVIRGFRFVNDIPLNKAHPDLLVNFLEFWEIDGDKEKLFSWCTDLKLDKENVTDVTKGGRTRWKVENETFNTLKNLGYHFEHNYGHGEQHLSSVFAFLMMLAFLIDQIQELCCGLFDKARHRLRSRITFWERVRSLFLSYFIDSWQTFWDAIIARHMPYPLQPQPP
jgi:hypothetical protein